MQQNYEDSQTSGGIIIIPYISLWDYFIPFGVIGRAHIWAKAGPPLDESPVHCRALCMRGNLGLTAAVLTVMSVLTFSLMSLLCLWCKRKSKIVQEDHQIYPPRTFRHGGSIFAVTRSKTVIRASQIASGEPCFNISTVSDTVENQSDYENVMSAQTGSTEHAYIEPLPIITPGNEEHFKKMSEEDQTPGVYGNIACSPSQEDEDYENMEYLNEVEEKQENEEPDYVNANGDW
eukprot:XP_011609462.1 PREDICTED: linker for activation of T-cells family member 2-like isoform X2 [Takifugu rubripes]